MSDVFFFLVKDRYRYLAVIYGLGIVDESGDYDPSKNLNEKKKRFSFWA